MVHPFRMAPKQTDPQFKLRLTPELKDRIERSAAVAGRSMNAEILLRLEAAYADEDNEIEHVRLSLPKDVMGSIAITALAYDQSLNDYVAGAVQREANHLARYKDAYEEMEELRGQIYDLEQKLIHTSDSANAWRLLHEQKKKTGNVFANLLSSTIKEILDYGDQVPGALRKFALGMRSSLNSSIPDLFDDLVDEKRKDG